MFRLILLSCLAPLAVVCGWSVLRRAGVRSEIARRIYLFVLLAALAIPFVLIVAVLASTGGKVVVVAAFLLVALIPFLLSGG